MQHTILADFENAIEAEEGQILLHAPRGVLGGMGAAAKFVLLFFVLVLLALLVRDKSKKWRGEFLIVLFLFI